MPPVVVSAFVVVELVGYVVLNYFNILTVTDQYLLSFENLIGGFDVLLTFSIV